MKKMIWFAFLVITQSINAQWVNDPLNNTIINNNEGTHMLPKVTVNPDGSYYFSWYGGVDNVNMNLAYFNHEGQNLWTDNAFLVSNHPQNGWVDDYVLLSDSDGNAIIVFSDIRQNSTKNVVAYKISNQGEQLWGEDGILFSVSNSDDYTPKAAILSNNNLYISCYTSYTNGFNSEIKLYKLDENGNKLWGESGKTFSSEESLVFPEIFVNEDGGFSLAYYKETGSFPAITRELAMMRFDADGEQLWDNPAIVTNAGGISSWDVIKLKKDLNGGAYFVWNDDRYNDMIPESYAQHVDGNGETQWEENGVLISTLQNTFHLYGIPVGVNEAGDFIVLWNKLNSTQSQGALMYQRISPAGERLETDYGKTVISMTPQMQNGFFAMQNHDTSFFFYSFFLPGSMYLTSHNVLALDAQGEMLWENPTELCTSEIPRNHPSTTGFYENQTVVVWSDTQDGEERIMAQNIFIDGKMGTSTVGIDNILSKDSKQYFTHFKASTNTVYLKNIENNDVITIYNMDGKIILRTSAKPELTVNLASKGLYIGRLSRNGESLENFKILNN